MGKNFTTINLRLESDATIYYLDKDSDGVGVESILCTGPRSQQNTTDGAFAILNGIHGETIQKTIISISQPTVNISAIVPYSPSNGCDGDLWFDENINGGGIVFAYIEDLSGWVQVAHINCENSIGSSPSGNTIKDPEVKINSGGNGWLAGNSSGTVSITVQEQGHLTFGWPPVSVPTVRDVTKNVSARVDIEVTQNGAKILTSELVVQKGTIIEAINSQTTENQFNTGDPVEIVYKVYKDGSLLDSSDSWYGSGTDIEIV